MESIISTDYTKGDIYEDISLAVTMGKIQAYSYVDIFGASFNISDDDTVQDAWEPGTEYTFSTTSDIDTLSSGSTADVGHLIKITGILSPESDGESVGYARLNGQNKVLIYDNVDLTGTPIKFFRVRLPENEEKSTDYGGLGNLAGIVYCYVDTAITAGVPTDTTKLRATINDGNNQTLMGIYTVPPKKVGFLFQGEVGMEFDSNPTGPEYLRLQYRSRRYQHVFKVKKNISLSSAGNSIYQEERPFRDPLPGLTDIKITKVSASDDMGMFASFQILLVDETEFPVEYLQKIQQPGY